MSKTKGIRKISRRCIICGNKSKITLYQDRHYRGGQYFGKINLPIGAGEYKRVGETKISKKRLSVVKWSGKEKELEYWECNSCYEEGQHECWLEGIIEKLYGKRCRDYVEGCACCFAWSVYDVIIDHNHGRI